MKLQFLPRGDAMPLEPFAPMRVGQPARRIGRKFNPVTKEHDLEEARKEARAEVTESLTKKDSAAKVSKPGHTGEVTQTVPAKDKVEAFERAWTDLGEAADVL